ncbi:MAG: hypothetical protein NXI00_00535 [Cytophagales bacterium]|nr:hypothetical protein [Cytophagales bacterium]
MAHIAIPLPQGKGKQDVEIEVTINGEKQQLHYRVELFYWEDCTVPTVDRAECIKHLLKDYDHDWRLYFIGSPTDEFVPITFVKRDEMKKVMEKTQI